jgi:hypothetical protein
MRFLGKKEHMEKFFQDLLKKTKAIENGTHAMSHTFEYDLFKKTAWILDDSKRMAKIEAEYLPTVETKEVNDFKLSVLFVGDTFLEGEDLLAKMIVAMKLKNDEFYRLKSHVDADFDDPAIKGEIFEKILGLKPQLVISLGASVTHLLLDRKEKMSGIHGKFFSLSSSNHEGEIHNYKLMPLFHPDFLLINPNMKRTAWIDLQKVMELLGKN